MTPPEAPTVRVLRFMPPDEQDQLFSQKARFLPGDWLDRLVCPVGDQPGWRLLSHEGLVARYRVACPGSKALFVQLDFARAPPAAPVPLRLADAAGFPKYREAMVDLAHQHPKAALQAIDRARELSPQEPLYQRQRVYLLYAAGRLPEAIVEADALLRAQPNALLYKYRALAARDLGLKEEVLASVEGVLRTCPRAHPLYADALCAKGMYLSAEHQPHGEAIMVAACRLKDQSCCAQLEALRAERAKAAARALQMANDLAASRALRVRVVPREEAKSKPSQPGTPGPAQAKPTRSQDPNP